MINVIIFIVWVLSVVFSAKIMCMREIGPNPLSILIVCCPIVNTGFVLVRFKHLKALFPCFGNAWMDDTLKKL